MTAGSDRTLVMTSPADTRTGLVVERRFEVPPTGKTFTHRNRFTNVADHPVTWSIWEVCQVDTSTAYEVGVLGVGVDDHGPPVTLLSVVGAPALGHSTATSATSLSSP